MGNSLRSFRNSVHRHSGQHDFDLEKLDIPKDVIDSESERQAHKTSSSLILASYLTPYPRKTLLTKSIASDCFTPGSGPEYCSK